MLRKLFDLLRSSPGDPTDEMRRLAAMLMLELKLYNKTALDKAGSGESLPDGVVDDLARAFETYASRFGASEEAQAIFRAEAAQALSSGDVTVIESALRARQAEGPPPLQPS